MSGIIFIISAPSGSGKSTLTSELRRIVPDLEFSISYTTRPPRGSEQSGREYFFIGREEFERMIREDEFLEWAEVFGNYYGTAKRFLARSRCARSRSAARYRRAGRGPGEAQGPGGGKYFRAAAVPPGTGAPAAAPRRGGRRSATETDGGQRAALQYRSHHPAPLADGLAARLRISASTIIFWSTIGWRNPSIPSSRSWKPSG